MCERRVMPRPISTRLFPKKPFRSGLLVEVLSACREDILASIFGGGVRLITLRKLRTQSPTSFATNCRTAYREIAMSLDRFPS